MLQSILCQRPGMIPLTGEPQFLRYILQSYTVCVETWQDDSHYFFSDREHALRSFSATLQALLNEISSCYDGQSLVLKAPEFVELTDPLAQLRPDDERVMILRDPRDVVALQLEASLCEIAAGHPPYYLAEKRSRNYYRTAAGRLSAVGQLARKLEEMYKNGRRWTAVRYEDLVDPATSLEVLAELQVQDGDRIRNAPWNRAAFDFLEDTDTFQKCWRSRHWNTPMRSDLIGHWKGKLSAEEVEAVESSCPDFFGMWTDARTIVG